MNQISSDVRNNIVHLASNGLSCRKIAIQVGVSYTTIHNICKEMRPCVQKQRGGRPAKLSAVDKRKLIRLVTSGAADTAVQLQNELRNTIQIQISAQTLRNVLKVH